MKLIHVIDSKQKAFIIEVEEDVSGTGFYITGVSLASQTEATRRHGVGPRELMSSTPPTWPRRAFKKSA